VAIVPQAHAVGRILKFSPDDGIGEVVMKKYLVLYRSSVSPRDQMAHATPEQMKTGMDEWMAWSTKQKSHIVDLGTPFGEGKQVAPSGAASGAKETIGGYSILQAASLDEAVKTVQGHPHFHSPDASITVLEMMPIPGM
jgi:hypothetical protein